LKAFGVKSPCVLCSEHAMFRCGREVLVAHTEAQGPKALLSAGTWHAPFWWDVE
jgi:hypothetical protein